MIIMNRNNGNMIVIYHHFSNRNDSNDGNMIIMMVTWQYGNDSNNMNNMMAI